MVIRSVDRIARERERERQRETASTSAIRSGGLVVVSSFSKQTEKNPCPNPVSGLARNSFDGFDGFADRFCATRRYGPTVLDDFVRVRDNNIRNSVDCLF